MGGINANGARISTLNDGRFRVRAVYYSVRHLSTSFACRTSWTAHTRSPTSTTPSVIGKRRAYRLQTDGQTLVCDMSEHETAWPELACVSDGGAVTPPAVGDRGPRRTPTPRRHRQDAPRGCGQRRHSARQRRPLHQARNGCDERARDLMTRFKGVPSADIIKMMRDHRAPPCCHRISPGPWTSEDSHR
jgi:hypothetical protein